MEPPLSFGLLKYTSPLRLICVEKDEDKASLVKEAQSATPPVKEEMRGAPANDDDLFGDDASTTEESGELFYL